MGRLGINVTRPDARARRTAEAALRWAEHGLAKSLTFRYAALPEVRRVRADLARCRVAGLGEHVDADVALLVEADGQRTAGDRPRVAGDRVDVDAVRDAGEGR